MGPTPVVSSRYDSAPRHPRAFAGVAGRAARALTTAFSALALAVGAVAVAPSSARADDTITTQDYFSYYKLDQARAKGYTGKGVTIAMIDGPVDTSAPELAGANITDKSRCTVNTDNESRTHGTAIASLLVSKDYGFLPDATLHTYQTSFRDQEPSAECHPEPHIYLDGLGELINFAINDGAQIITISIAAGQIDAKFEPILNAALSRAINQGIIVVTGMGNTSTDNDGASYASRNGTVGVSAVNLDGSFASDYSSSGYSVTTAAFGGPIKVRDYEKGSIRDMRGTSIATPIVAASLALARQKWPDASSNQLLQSLIHTGLSPQHEWNQYTGYGPIDIGALVKTDPSQYPDENPVIHKSDDAFPTAEMTRDYKDGRAVPQLGRYDDTYVYRGTDDIYFQPGYLVQTPHLGTSPAYHRK